MMTMGALSRRGQGRLSGLAFVLLIGTAWPAWGAPVRNDDPGTVLDQGESTQQALQELLLARAADAVQSPLESQVLAFYSARDFAPAWSGGEAAEMMAAYVLPQLQHAVDQGLDPKDYVSAQLLAPVPQDGPGAAQYDVALTEALFHYASDLAIGRIAAGAAYKDVRLPAPNFDLAALLIKALARRELTPFFSALPPPHPEYHALAAALARYRAIVALGGWPSVPLAGDTEKLIARRMAFEDPLLSSNSDPSPTDVELALVRYQIRNGLKTSGKADRATLDSLNVPPTQRIKQIMVNMERWRWLPRNFERRYVRVNVPDQSVDLIENGDVALHSKVIIGKKVTPTPILRTEIVAVVANPEWDIPDDISARDLLPHLRQNPNYLTVRKFSLVDGPPDDPQGQKINWRQVKPDKLPYQIEQPPGADNVLGHTMLDSPNDFDVYMHDTPNQKLFTLDDREASNGCVRVEEIDALAALVMKEDGQSEDRLETALDSGETQSLALRHPLPVYMLYWTAIAGPDGTVGFRPDRYNRDAVLLAKMTGKAKLPAMKAVPVKITAKVTPVKVAPIKTKKSDRNHI